MSETKDLLGRGVKDFEPMPDAFERVLARRDRKRRNQRVAAGVLGIAVFALAAIGTLRAFSSGTVPADKTPLSPFVGTWELFAHNSLHTLELRVAGDGTFALELSDEAATVCDGLPATETGVGTLSSSTEMTVASQVITCQDGSVLKDVPPATYTYDPETDALTDNLGAVWERAGGNDPSPGPTISGSTWPQTSLEEIRQAQELADAGDPGYTWQVDPRLTSEEWWAYLREPGTEIVERFLREELGWVGFLFNPYAENGVADGAIRGVVYLRCGPGETNSLYPTAPVGHQEAPGAERCAPTIDDLTYETVSLDLAQLDRRGREGIWVVSRWATSAPFTMTDPAVAEAAATARLEAFAQARIDDEGAEGYVEVGGAAVFGTLDEFPLLYTTTTGARYERYEIEVVSEPRWPYGDMEFNVRLFAEGGETVVEQPITLSNARLFHDATQTTENGQPLAVPYGFFDGEVTARAPYPWAEDAFVNVGLALNGEYGERLEFVNDPLPVKNRCAPGPAPADAEALARTIESDPDLVATAPVRVSVGGAEGLAMDVSVAPGGSVCDVFPSTLVLTQGHGYSGSRPPGVDLGQGSRMRLYLVDMPEGSSMRILAIAIVAQEVRFESVNEAATPVLDSIEFHAR